MDFDALRIFFILLLLVIIDAQLRRHAARSSQPCDPHRSAQHKASSLDHDLEDWENASAAGKHAASQSAHVLILCQPL